MTLHDLKIEITKIREAINSVEIKGKENASLIVYAFSKCDELINRIDGIISEKTESIQNGEIETKGVEENGE